MSETFFIYSSESVETTGADKRKEEFLRQVNNAIEHQYSINPDEVAVYVASTNSSDFMLTVTDVNENTVESRNYTLRGDYGTHTLYQNFCNMVNSLDLDSFSTSDEEKEDD